MSAKRLTTIAMLVAHAIVLQIIETLLPNPFPIPGVKLGLANIITLLALVLYDFRTAFAIAFLRSLLGSLLIGTLFSTGFFLSLSGAIVSTCLMALLLRLFPGFNLLGVSVAGAAAHNLGQLALAALIIGHAGVYAYLPVMLLFSLPTGLLTGYFLKSLLSHLRSSNHFSELL